MASPDPESCKKMSVRTGVWGRGKERPDSYAVRFWSSGGLMDSGQLCSFELSIGQLTFFCLHCISRGSTSSFLLVKA